MVHIRGEIIHHLYKQADDLLPFCGTYPGWDPETGDFNAGHDRDTLLEFLEAGMTCCAVCLSPAALGGWTPLALDDGDDLDPPLDVLTGDVG